MKALAGSSQPKTPKADSVKISTPARRTPRFSSALLEDKKEIRSPVSNSPMTRRSNNTPRSVVGYGSARKQEF